jgi:arylsulfatase A-like enzyme
VTTWSKPRIVVAQALGFGLLTGLLEAGLVGVKSQVLGRFVRVGPDLAWMAPFADAMVFLAIGLAVIGGSYLWAQLGRPMVATLVLAFFASLSALLMYYPLQSYAKFLLASGLAVQTARVLHRWRAPFERLIGPAAIALTCLVALLALVTLVGPSLAYRWHVASLPAAAPSSPNVLLVVWDTVRARNLSLYGYGRPTTPNLEKWAQSSVVFDRANSTSPWTLPSHASMLTGRLPHELSADWEEALDRQHRTLAEALSERGYVTAGFVGNTYYCGYELGLARGFARYDDYVVTPQEVLISSSLLRVAANRNDVRRLIGYYDNIPRQNASAITERFLAWQLTATRPFFAFVNFFDAHEVYLPPAPFAGVFGHGPPHDSPQLMQDVRRSFRRNWAKRPAEEIEGEINMYDAAIAYLDAELNRLLVALEARGVLDNTIVIVTADHGEQFGEHGLFLHANSLYQPLLHVPLVIRFPPRVPMGRRVEARVTLRDLPATVMDLLAPPATQELPGQSLARHWTEAASSEALANVAIADVRYADWAADSSPSYPVAKGDMASITDDHYHYIKNGDGSEELYAIAEDPEERHDISKRDDSERLLERYRKALIASLGANRAQ